MENNKIRSICFILLLFLLYIPPVYADRQITLQPTKTDLSETAIREIVSDFFSVKWGLPKEVILKAKMYLELWTYEEPLRSHPDILDSFVELPQWTIYVYGCPETNGENIGSIGLSRTGEILWWNIRSSKYL